MDKIKLILSFLKNLLKGFRKKDVKPIGLNESLSRFVFNRNQYNTTSIKGNAFLPPEHNLETSVFRRDFFDSLNYKELKTKISKIRNKKIKVVALIKVNDVLSNSLKVKPEETEHRWHANIVNWPKNKDERKAIAQEIARNAEFEL